MTKPNEKSKSQSSESQESFFIIATPPNILLYGSPWISLFFLILIKAFLGMFETIEPAFCFYNLFILLSTFSGKCIR